MADSALARILFLAVGLLGLYLARSEGSSCSATTFYAKSVSSVNSSLYLYYTRRGVASVAECAQFCADRQYCRSAIYDFESQACSISYDWTVNCRGEPQRFSSFDRGDAKLALVACIKKCDKKEKDAKYDEKVSSNHDPTLTVRIKTLEDVVKPRDDTRTPTSETMPSTELQKLVKMVGVKTVTADGQILVDDGEKITEVHLNETLGVEDPKASDLKGKRVETPTGSEKETDPIVLRNGKIVAIKNETTLRDSEGKTSVERTIERVQRLLEEVASGVDPKVATEKEGFLNKVVIEGIQSYNVGKPKEKVESEHSGDSGHITVVHRPRGRACFDTAPKQLLNGAEFKTFTNVTLDECRCACAKTHIEDSKQKCKSLQYTVDGDCTLNKDDHNGKYDLVYDRVSEYHFVKCAPAELMEIGRKRCYKDEPQTTTEEPSTTAWTTTTELPTTEAEVESTTVPEATVSEESTKVPAESLLSSSTEVVSSTNSSEEDDGDLVAATTEPTVPPTSDTPFEASRDKCFEVIDGYLTKSLAGGLEHDVSLEECECYCANSIASGRYAFQCQSAIYYHDERDCVLNLDNRKVRPELFVQSGDYNVTYLGMLCTPEDAASVLVDHSKKHGCLTDRKTTTKAPTTPQPPKPTTGAYSDNCFLELPHYVLEGNALAIETNVSVEECKCFCIDSDHRYGSECQSVQYYYDSMTCLLNKENRITNPDRFNYAHGSVVHSYFDFRCQAEETTLSVYVDQVCSETIKHDETPPPPPPLTNSVTEEDDTSIDENSVEVPSEKSSEKPTTTILATTEASALSETMKMITFDPVPSTAEQSMEVIKFVEVQDSTTSSPITNKPKTTTKAVPKSTPEPEMETVEFETTTKAPKTSLPTTAHSSESFITESTTKATVISASEEEDDKATSSSEDDPTTELTSPSTSTTTTTEIPKTTATKKPHIAELEETTEEKVTKMTTTPTTTTTTTTYAPVGPCRYSALYQTVFRGSRLIKRLVVSSPAQCFSACHHEGCRSANLIAQGQNMLKFCELFRDSIIDYRRNDLLSFDLHAVHFDGVSCDAQ